MSDKECYLRVTGEKLKSRDITKSITGQEWDDGSRNKTLSPLFFLQAFFNHMPSQRPKQGAAS